MGLIEELKKAIESPEFGDDMNEYFVAQERREKRISHYSQKLAEMPSEKRLGILHNIVNKYEKDWTLYEKATNIYEVILDFAFKYGQPLVDNDDSYSTKKYVIDDKFTVEFMCGQGECVCHVKENKDDEIFVKDIKDESVEVFKPNGELLVKTDNVLVFNEILVQINQKSISGYHIVFRGERYDIDKNGYIKNCKGLFGQIDRQMRILMGF
jgi:hypothetical protein